jgi:hypothetical protein
MGSVPAPAGKGPGKDYRQFRETARGARPITTARRVGCVLPLLLLLLYPPACGYRLQGRPDSHFADPGIRVDLRPFKNESLVVDGGAFLASRLREEMRRNGFRGRFERSMADYLVEGSVEGIQEQVTTRGEGDFGLEYRMTVLVSIRVVEITRGRLLWKEDGLTDSESYYAGSDFQYTESNRRIAFEEICRRLARDISQTLREVL